MPIGQVSTPFDRECLRVIIRSLLVTPCSIARTISSQFGGSSSTVNELCAASGAGVPSPTTLSHRREFGSEADIRYARSSSTTAHVMPLASNLRHPHVQHSSSSSALRPHDYQYAVSYAPQTARPLGSALRSHSVQPYPQSASEHVSSLALPTRPPTHHNHGTSTASLNSTVSGATTITAPLPGSDARTNPSRAVPLSRRMITENPKGTYRVTFSDNSVMIIYADYTDGQIFVDAQGARYSFDRRQPHQPPPIQERLTLMYEDEHDFVESHAS